MEFSPADIRNLFADLANEASQRSSSQSEVARLARSLLDQSQRTVKTAGSAEDIAALDFGTSLLLEELAEDASAQRRLRERLELIRMVAESAGLYQPLTQREGIDERLRPSLDAFNAARQKNPAVDCDDPEVPKPPRYSQFLTWKDVHKVELDGNSSFEQHDFATKGKAHPTDIFFYETKDPPGMCALLQRYLVVGDLDDPKVPKTVAALCQGKGQQRKACFWQAKIEKLDSKQIREHLETYDSISKSDGWAMGEQKLDVCTACHSGNNAFVQYRGRTLCYPNFSDSADQHCFLNKNGQTTALGFEGEVMQTFESATGCASCHSIQTTDKPRYCDYLKFVVERMMPPDHDHKGHPLVWSKDPHSLDPKLDKAITELRTSFCNDNP